MKKNILIIAVFFIQTHFINAQKSNTELQIVAELPVRPANIAVTKEGRIFATIHPLGSSELQLVEITGKNKFKPYPNDGFQKNGKPASEKTFDAPLGIAVDKNGNLLVLDMGLTLGKTRLFRFDTKKNLLISSIELSESVASKGSFVQDLAVDEVNGWVYMADIINPAIIALNIKTKEARRFGNHPSLQAEDKDMIIDEKLINFNGGPARVAIDPITISNDKQTLYYGAMNGTSWYEISTKFFRNNADDKTIADNIKTAGRKPISDGALTDDKGNHYFTNTTEHAVSKLDTNGNLSNILQDKRLQWPDNLAINKEWMYICTNQLNTTPAFTGGKDEGKAPYYIYKFKYNSIEKSVIQDKYTLNSPSLYPEGIDYDYNNNRFIIGSLYKGEVFTLSLDGKLSSLISQSKITAIAGVFTDEIRNRLIVVGGDIGISKKSLPKGASAGKNAYAEIYDLRTGILIRCVDLKFLTPNGGAVANDIAVDENGNIYITDSFSPVIYKLDKYYKASIFAENELFRPAPGTFGLNGILFHPDGYLLVCKTDSEKLFKVNIANPTQISEVVGISFKAPDGLEFTKDGKLVLVGDAVKGDGKAYTFTSNDHWKTASKVNEMSIGKDEFPTTAALLPNGEVYVVSAKLGKLLSGDTDQSVFAIQKLK
ncbi:hypothetical protein D0817_23855 [Flavobacterium cupreum]|uniref:Major royal jelly protein n=2 Tax=Flavobacterium TaxID=237 RepID=A0A4Y7UEB7_9FLAO|nr:MULTISPECIES: L-dopachrome tautomerase-related protein [Flavobacterium]RUT67905.1 hypothetical protein D0817_23855 [Flavobacterium cupreum]TCN59497.1 major royal jelly protein [Flavobacterium circumlabens]TEB44793.1 hypothetical protein D0809_06235 [Flavobacterium circumlabens]